MHIFGLMVWGGFFVLWPRFTSIMTIVIPVTVFLLLLLAHPQ